MENPNVLWISLESVRSDHTSLYGYHRRTTPHLESLSKRPDATKLDPMISSSMWTPASTASMLTGTHMSTHQVGQDGRAKQPLRSSIKTLPELLSKDGYNTVLFSTNAYIGKNTGLDRGFDHIEYSGFKTDHFKSMDSLMLDSIYTVLRCFIHSPTVSLNKFKRKLSSAQNNLLESRLSRWVNQNDRRDPFFAYAHVPSPHHPYFPPSEYIDSISAELNIATSEAINRVHEIYYDAKEIKKRMANGLDISDETWEIIKALYDAEIKFADKTVGNIVKKVEEESDRPTLIIIVGDHGDLFGEYGLIGHNLVLHDGVIKVPGLVIGLDGVEDTEDSLTQHIDLTYTVASLTDVLTDQFQGRDLRNPDRPYAISQRGVGHLDDYKKHNPSFDTSNIFSDPFTSVRTTDYKLLSSESGQMLYCLPDEEKDVSKDNAKNLELLNSYLDKEGINWQTAEEKEIDFDKSTKERLRRLGYIE